MLRYILVFMLLFNTVYAQVKTAQWDQEIPAEDYFKYVKPKVHQPVQQYRHTQSYQYQYVDPEFSYLLEETERVILGHSIPNMPIEDRLTMLEQVLRIPVSYGTEPQVRLQTILQTAVQYAQRARMQQQRPPLYTYNRPMPGNYYDPERYSTYGYRYQDPYSNGNTQLFLQVLPSIIDLFRRNRYR